MKKAIYLFLIGVIFLAGCEKENQIVEQNTSASTAKKNDDPVGSLKAKPNPNKHCKIKPKGKVKIDGEGKIKHVEIGGSTRISGFSFKECWKKIKKFFSGKTLVTHAPGDGGEAEVGYEATDLNSGVVHASIDTIIILEPMLVEKYRTELSYDVQLLPGTYIYNPQIEGYTIPFEVLSSITLE